MKRIFLLAVISVALVFGTAGAAWAQGKEAAKPKTKTAAKPMSALAEFTKIENERNEAITKADMATLDKMTADDYTIITSQGRMEDKKEALGAIKTGQTKIASITLSDLKVRMYGNTAILTGRGEMKGTQGGNDISGTILFTRVYVKEKGGWKSVAFQQTAAAKP